MGFNGKGCLNPAWAKTMRFVMNNYSGRESNPTYHRDILHINTIYLSDGEHERLSPLVRVVELGAVDEGGDVVEVDAVLPAHDLVPRAVAVAHRLDGQVLVQLLQRDVEDQHGVRRDDAAARS